MEFEPIKGTPPEVCWIECSALQPDKTYQRSIGGKGSSALIQHIATHWDWRLCSPLTVSHREDSDGAKAFFVIDGQHRLAAAEMRGDIPMLPCIVSVFDSYEEEVMAFVEINDKRKSVITLDKYHARVAAKEELALKIKNAVEIAGLTVARSNDPIDWKPGEISFPDVIARRVENKKEAVIRALMVLKAAYPNTPLIRGRAIYEGIVYIFTNMAERIDGREEALRIAITSEMQNHWYNAARTYSEQGSTPIPWDRSMATVLMERIGKNAPVASTPAQPKAPPPPPPAPRVFPPQPPIDSRKKVIQITGALTSDNRKWCEQCEQRVTKEAGAQCTRAFCKGKG